MTILANIRPWGADPVDIAITDGVITAIEPSLPGQDRLDGRGLLAIPGLVNTHAHVDKSWFHTDWQPYGGEPTLQGRIDHERARRKDLNIPSAQATAAVLRQFVRYGTTAVRTHVDVDTGIGLGGIEAVTEAFATYFPELTYQIVAFPQDGLLRRPGVDQLLERAAALGVSHIGGLDPAGIDRDPVRSLDVIFGTAASYGCGVDIHLHDSDELGAFQLELICDQAIARNLVGKTTVAHGMCLSELPPGRQAELVARMAQAGVSLTTVAPLGPGPLPLDALRANGIDVGLGTDGIRDLWAPYGDGDLLKVALQFAKLHRARYDAQLCAVLHQATDAAACFVTPTPAADTPAAPVGLTVGAKADIVLLDAENPMDALVRAPQRELVLASGITLAQADHVRGDQ